MLWSDSPPLPTTLQFLGRHADGEDQDGWVDLVIDHYVDYCKNITRTSTVYFAQNGDDTLGDGSILLPYKTRSKADSLHAPYREILFRRGDSWESELTVTVSDHGDTGMKFGTYGDPLDDQPGFIVEGVRFGISISGDGSWIDDIYCSSSGSDPAGSGGTFELAQHGSSVGLCTNCQGFGGQKHCAWGIAAGAGGGIWVYQNCTMGSNQNSAGGSFLTYSETGGSTFIVDGCTGYSGSDAGASPCVFGHTGSGTFDLFIVRNLHVNAGVYPYRTSVDFAYGASATLLTDARAFEIGTVMDMKDGNSCILTQTNFVRLNCHWSIRPIATNGLQNLQLGASGWLINSTLEYDDTDGYGHEYFYLTFSGGAILSHPHLWNNHFVVSNLTFNIGFDDLVESGTSGQNRFTDGTFYNNIIVSGVSGAGGDAYIGLEGITADGNATRGISSSFGAYATDTHRIALSAAPTVGAEPALTSQLYGTARALPGSLVLEFDQRGRGRGGVQEVGPIQSSRTSIISDLDSHALNMSMSMTM